MTNILVIGSSNTDMVVKTSRLPKPGETIIGGEFFMNPGGKGANQAVAAAKLGANVTLIAKVGGDMFGSESIQNFKKVGMNTNHIFINNEVPSGVALINVDENAENTIVVASGANNTLSVKDIQSVISVVDMADIILMQLEIPLEVIEFVIHHCKAKNKKVVLNPAPAARLPEGIYSGLFAITPNETEAEILTGIKVADITSAKQAAKILLDKGVKIVVITMGSQGAFVYTSKMTKLIPGYKVDAVDTTAAGDTFNGAFCFAIESGMEMEEAIDFANKAAAISVTRMGAQVSSPNYKEVMEFKISD